MQNAQNFLRSEQFDAARQLQTHVEWALNTFRRVAQELRSVAGPLATLDRPKRRALVAIDRFRAQSQRQIRILGVRREVDGLASVLKRAVYAFPDPRTLGIHAGRSDFERGRPLHRGISASRRFESRYRRGWRGTPTTLLPEIESPAAIFAGCVEQSAAALAQSAHSYQEWFQFFERQITEATLELSLAISHAFDRAANCAMDQPQAIVTQWMWRQYAGEGRSNSAMKLAVAFGFRSLSPER